MNPVIEHCLRADPGTPAVESVAGWRRRRARPRPRWPQPIARSIAEGFDADRVAWAFAAGYQAALRALVPGLPDDPIVAFCVTEEAGNRPRDLRTRVDEQASGGVLVTGAKRWATLGVDADLLLVAGSASAPGESRPRVRVVRVPADSAGLTRRAMPATRFVPEVPHAFVELERVCLPADAVLPGDGYDAYVKPFRTHEDTHVTAAVLAYLLRECRARRWPPAFAERLVAALCALGDLASGDPASPEVHVALSGAQQWAGVLYAEADGHWAAAGDDPAALRWRRDAALFRVASGTRERRAARSWERLAGPAGGAR